MEPQRARSQWVWVAVAAIAAIAVIAVALIITLGGKSASNSTTASATATTQTTPQSTTVTKTVGSSTTTIIQQVTPNGGPSPASNSCGSGITVNSQTSCPFAQNVYYQYQQAAQQAGSPGSFQVYAYSPATSQSYTESCTYNAGAQLVSCSHGSDLIQFRYA